MGAQNTGNIVWKMSQQATRHGAAKATIPTYQKIPQGRSITRLFTLQTAIEARLSTAKSAAD
jgi:hypothetical protein